MLLGAETPCIAHLHMIAIDAFQSLNSDPAGRPTQSIYPYRAWLLMTPKSAVVTKVAVSGEMVLKPARAAHLHMIWLCFAACTGFNRV
jgi:hypothetical protein